MAIKQFHAGLTAVLPLLLIATAARADTALQPRLTVRPVTRGDIAAYKLPATTQTSGGLYTVGLGQPLYLELQLDAAIPASDITDVKWLLMMKPATSKAALVDSPLGKEVPVFEPADREVIQAVGRKLLRPDLKGYYTVQATVTTAKGETASTAQTFVAASYVGMDQCVGCHGGGLVQNMVPSFSKTAHNSIFKEGMDGIASDHYGQNCLACHTVGYDTNSAAVNGGFDDVAKQLGWIFPTTLKEGTFDALPAGLKNVGNIQCENCHGPGSAHVKGAFFMGISVSSGSGVCAQCHDAPNNHIKSREWSNSVHAVATREPSGAGREGCVGCHTGAGFRAKSAGAAITDTSYTSINCQTCHEPHGQTTPDGVAHLVRTTAVKLADGTNVTDGGLGMLCMNCHQSRRNAATYAATQAGSAHFGPHRGPQTDMLEGVNGFTYGQNIPSSAHGKVVEDTCVACHMQTVATTEPGFSKVGGHTFKLSLAGDGTNPPVILAGACQKCHGAATTEFNYRHMDYDGDTKIDGVQTEVQHLLDQLSALLPPVGQPKTELTIDSTWTRPQLQAAYNWLFVHDDGSLGIHNTAYAVGLLKASIADLKAQK